MECRLVKDASLGTHVLKGSLLAWDGQHVLLVTKEPYPNFLLLHDATCSVLPPRTAVIVWELWDLFEFELARPQPLLDVVQVGPDLAVHGTAALMLLRLRVLVQQIWCSVQDGHHSCSRCLLVTLLSRVKMRCCATKALDWNIFCVEVHREFSMTWPHMSELLRARAQNPVVQRWRGHFTLLQLLLPKCLALHDSLMLLRLPIVLIRRLTYLNHIADWVRKRGESTLTSDQCIWAVKTLFLVYLSFHGSLVTIKRSNVNNRWLCSLTTSFQTFLLILGRVELAVNWLVCPLAKKEMTLIVKLTSRIGPQRLAKSRKLRRLAEKLWASNGSFLLGKLEPVNFLFTVVVVFAA